MFRYFIPSNLNLPPTSPQQLPLLKMDSQTSDKIQQTVAHILKNSDIDTATEKHVRDMAAAQLGVDLSDLPHKVLVRQVIESFLLAQQESTVPVAVEGTKPNVVVGPSEGDTCRIICKLSQQRDVAVRSPGGKTVVSIRDFFWKDGKQIQTPKCFSLFSDQWSIFRNSIPAIEEAITKVESRLRSEVEKKKADDDTHERSEKVSKENGHGQDTAEPMQKDATPHRPGLVAIGKKVENASTVSSAPRGLVPLEIIRFDGNNYQQWVDSMDLYLNHMKVAYVLSDPCPSVGGVTDGELGQTLTAEQKWIDDDHICRQNILNSLCDHLFCYYSKIPGTAKDLWEELKLIYLYEEHGAKVSLVKKYMEFQIIEEKSVFEQVQELHNIADSLMASGMYVEEKFHVNVIISKLPPSWKPYSIQLMKEDFLPVWMLMDHLKAEEVSRQKENKHEARLPRADVPAFRPAKKLGPQRIPMKRPGVPPASHEGDRDKKMKFCNICKKKGHFPEQCWFRNSSINEARNEKGNTLSAKVVAGVNTNEAAGQSDS